MTNATLVKEMLANYMTMHMDVDNVSDAALREEGAKVRAQLRDDGPRGFRHHACSAPQPFL